MIGTSGITGNFKGLPYLDWKITKHVSSPFTGSAAANRHGDVDGTNNPYTVFDITGDVLVSNIFGVVNTSLTDTAAAVDISLGVAGNTGVFVLRADATELLDGNIFASTALVQVGAGSNTQTSAVNPGPWMINDGANIIETLAVDAGDIDAGQIDYYVIWAPAEQGAFLVPTTPVA